MGIVGIVKAREAQGGAKKVGRPSGALEFRRESMEFYV
jgi:hypothetical protein